MDYKQLVVESLLRIEGYIRELVERGLNPLEPGAVDAPQLMDRQAVQAYLQISERTFFRLKKEGFLRANKIGGRDYFFKPDLAAAMQVSIQKGRV